MASLVLASLPPVNDICDKGFGVCVCVWGGGGGGGGYLRHFSATESQLATNVFPSLKHRILTQ